MSRRRGSRANRTLGLDDTLAQKPGRNTGDTTPATETEDEDEGDEKYVFVNSGVTSGLHASINQ